MSTVLRPGHIVRDGYYKLNPTEPLEKVLRHKQFVEFPTIEVWEDGAFTGTVVDDRGAVMHDKPDSEDERKPKRRKLNAKEGKKAINGLLGGYGSGSDDEDEKADEKDVMGLLAGYAGSDDEGGSEKVDQEENKPDPSVNGGSPISHLLDEDAWGDEDAEGETDDEYVEESAENVAAMLEKLRQAGALRDPSGDGRIAVGEEEDEEQVDWGDSGDEA